MEFASKPEGRFTSTLDGPGNGHAAGNGRTVFPAAVVVFALAFFSTCRPPPPATQLLDVHGAGAQRSDPKTGEPADYAGGHGPQGDVVYIYNYVRCVRDATAAGSYAVVDTG